MCFSGQKLTDRTAGKKSHKSKDTIVTVFIILHQLDDLAAEGGGAGQGADSETKRFVTGYHLWLLPTFHNFGGAEAHHLPLRLI